jgi:hypothetical protein
MGKPTVTPRAISTGGCASSRGGRALIDARAKEGA